MTSRAGTKLSIALSKARSAGVWGWASKPGTVAHWPGGIVVNFPAAGSVNGTAVTHIDAALTSTDTIRLRVADGASYSAEATQLVTSDTVAVNTKPGPEVTTRPSPNCPCNATEMPIAWKVARPRVP